MSRHSPKWVSGWGACETEPLRERDFRVHMPFSSCHSKAMQQESSLHVSAQCFLVTS